MLALDATATAIARVDRRQRPPRRRRPLPGTIEAVLECAANLACVGAEPLGLTNCLNFGNPEKPHIAWQLTESVSGLGDACRALDMPVVGGNVSLYNEGADGPIYPTPVVGMVGELPDPRARRPARLRRRGRRRSRWSGRSSRSSAARELAKLRGEPLAGPAGSTRAPSARCTRPSATRCARGQSPSAHDIAEGGLATALAECCLAGALGARVDELPGGDVDAVRRGAGRLRRHGRARGARAALLDAVVSARSAAMRWRSAATSWPLDDLRRRTARWGRCSRETSLSGPAGGVATLAALAGTRSPREQAAP